VIHGLIGVALVWPYIERPALVDCDVNSLQLVQKKPSSHPVNASEMKVYFSSISK
jgi:hypothetical protein